jgi:hypothetical protein
LGIPIQSSFGHRYFFECLLFIEANENAAYGPNKLNQIALYVYNADTNKAGQPMTKFRFMDEELLGSESKQRQQSQEQTFSKYNSDFKQLQGETFKKANSYFRKEDSVLRHALFKN